MTYKKPGHSNIIISGLKSGDIDDYLKIELEAFYEKVLFLFSGREEAAYSILRTGLAGGLFKDRYYNAVSGGILVGTIELVTKENSQSSSHSFYQFYKHLGFNRAVKAYFLTFFEIPNLDGKTIYIDNVAVEKNSRRQGIAREMLSFAEDYAKDNGKNTLKLWVASKNTNAFNLYKKTGFRQLVKRSSWITEKYFGYRDWVFMGKEV